jgi:hypothetical protein
MSPHKHKGRIQNRGTRDNTGTLSNREAGSNIVGYMTVRLPYLRLKLIYKDT